MRKSFTKTAAQLLSLLAITLAWEVIRNDAYAQTDQSVLAIVNGTKITQKEVDDSVISQILPLKEQMYALRKVALENLILRTILEGEAQKRGISVEELKKQMTSGKVEVSNAQVEELYSENASVFAAMSPDEAKERLRLDLESQERMKLFRDALAALRKNSRIELSLEEPRLPIGKTDAAPTIGPGDAAITIIEFSDFQCPYCRAAQTTIRQLLKEYRNQVRLVFKHLPLDIHADAFRSAQAAVCAGEQGLFWQYHDALFLSDDLSADALNKIASKVGLSLPKFKTCLGSEASRAAVLKDVREARQFGINSTPTFIVNGKLVRGDIGFEEFKALFEREIQTSRHASRPQ